MIGGRTGRLFKLAAKSLWLHGLRSLLTMLGMVFGVLSVVAMLAIGEGASRDAQQQYLRLGSRNIIVRSVKPPDSSSASATRTWVVAYGLELDDVDALRETVPGVTQLVSRRDIPMDLWNGGRKATGSVFGTEPAYQRVTNLRIDAGRFLTEEDARGKKNVCVLGAAVAEALFPGSDPLEGTVRVGSDYYSIVGVAGRRGTAPASGAGASGEEDSAIFVPLTAALERFSPLIQTRASGSRINERVILHQILLEVGDVGQVPAAAGALRALLAKRPPKEDVRITVPLELLEEAARNKRLFTYILGSIAGVSLLVGGIGIMNIMLASVTERTREIGIRRALGARRRDIIVQFLVETVILSGAGGALGVVLGVLIPFVVSYAAGMKTIITFWSPVLAFGISALVGVVFGIYPAIRAAQMDPVEALRHE